MEWITGFGKRIEVVQPLVAVSETVNSAIPGDRALTVPYDASFTYQSEEFRGASLAAMCSLGRAKGYRLIGTHRYGFNAFFMKDGVGEGHFPEVDPTTCLNDPVTTRGSGLNHGLAVSKLGLGEV